MRNPLTTLWADVTSPDVRRQVIAGLIVLALSAAAVYIWGVRNELTDPIYSWFAEAVRLQRWRIAAWLLTAFLAGLFVARAGRAPVAVAVEVPPAPAPAADEEPGAVPMDFSPNEHQRLILKGLLHSYPVGADLETVHDRLRVLSPFDTPAHSERQLEGLLNAEILGNARPDGFPPYYVFTQPGRDYALALFGDSTRDAESAQPAARPATRRGGPSASPMLTPQNPDEPQQPGPLEGYVPPKPEPATLSEVGAKLDLARSLMDMGDYKQATKLLNEVIAEGNGEHRIKAKVLKKRLLSPPA